MYPCIYLCDKTSVKRNLRKKRKYFSSQFKRLGFMADWLHCFSTQMKENIMMTGKQRNNNFGTRRHYQRHISPDFLLQDLPTKSPVSYKLDWVNTVITTEAFTVSSPVYCNHVRTRPLTHESFERYSIYKLYPWIKIIISVLLSSLKAILNHWKSKW